MAWREPGILQSVGKARGQRESVGLGDTRHPQGVGTPGERGILQHPQGTGNPREEGTQPQPHQGMGHSGWGHFPRDRSPPCHPEGHRTPQPRAPPTPPVPPQCHTCGEEVLGGPLGLGGFDAGGGRLGAGEGGVGQSQDPQGGGGEELQRRLGVHLGTSGGMSHGRGHGEGGSRHGGGGDRGTEGGDESPTLTSHRCGSQGPQNWGRGHKAGLGGEQGARGARVGVWGGGGLSPP